MAQITLRTEQALALQEIVYGHGYNVRLTETNIPSTGTVHVELLDAEMRVTGEARIDYRGTILGKAKAS